MCAISLCCFYSSSALAVDPFLDWYTFETENFVIHYSTGNKPTAEKAAVIAEKAHIRLSKELNWQPAEKTELIITDESDLTNGFATPLNFNRTAIFLAPPPPMSTLEDFDDWLTLLITHEYTHVLHLDKVRGAPASLREIFGRFFLLFPNIFVPPWITEGLATNKETNLEDGVGRGQSSLFAMMMREETAKGVKPVSQVNFPIATWPGGATRYLYGVYFMRFISETYGEDKLQMFIENYSNNLLPFSINTTFEQVFGKDVTAMWAEYEQWLHARFDKQIEEIKNQGVTKGEAITQTGYFNQPVRLNGDNVYYVRNAGNHQPELVRFKQGESSESADVLTEVLRLTGFRVHKEAGVLIAQAEICEEYSLYSDLYVFNEQKEELTQITECGRYLEANWMPDGKSIIALHHDAGKFELHRLSLQGEIEEIIWKSVDDEIVAQIDMSPDGKQLVGVVWRKGSGWNLELFDLQAKQWRAISSNTDIKAFPAFSDNGDSIIYSADYDGVYNLYRYDVRTKQHAKISNVVGGALQAHQLSREGPLYYVGYGAEGTDLYRMDKTSMNKPVALPVTKKLNSYDYVLEEHAEEEYSPWPGLKPRWWFPSLTLDDDSTEIGITTAGNDALGIHEYFLALAYETKNGIPLGAFAYTYSNRFLFALERSNNIFNDANGNFNRARPTNLAQAIFILPRTKVLTQHNFLLGVSWEKDSDHTLARGALPEEDFEDNILGLAWLYNGARVYPLSISKNDGMNIRLVAEDSDAFNSDFTGQVYTLDYKQYIRTGKESVLAFRVFQGWGNDSPNPFRLGGEDTGVSLSLFGITGTAVFAEREYALRGYDEGLPQLRGRRAQVVSAEWRFLIDRPERGIMSPPLGLMQWSGAVFVDSGAAYNDSSPDEYFTGAGAEINVDLNAFYLIPVRARLGYAHGFDEDIGDDRVYFQVGASF